jgi:hypothetical protein
VRVIAQLVEHVFCKHGILLALAKDIPNNKTKKVIIYLKYINLIIALYSVKWDCIGFLYNPLILLSMDLDISVNMSSHILVIFILSHITQDIEVSTIR